MKLTKPWWARLRIDWDVWIFIAVMLGLGSFMLFVMFAGMRILF
jgi:hypothetical protein